MSIKLAGVSTAELLQELQRRVNCSEKKEVNSIFVGPPGAGKGRRLLFLRKSTAFAICRQVICFVKL